MGATAVCSDINTKHKDTFCRQNEGCKNVEHGGIQGVPGGMDKTAGESSLY